MALAARLLGVRVARVLYGRWRSLAPAARQRLAPLAEDAKRQALELRGAADREAAARDLKAANETLAAALVESAEADPELGESEVRGLRDDLRRELDRLATADIQASRGAGRPSTQA
jgi:recombinational DNA repair ATPase RecF